MFTQPLRSDRIWHKVNFLSGVWIQSFPSPRLVASPRLKNLVCPTILKIIDCYYFCFCAKNLEVTILFVDFSKVFDSKLREDEANTARLQPNQRNRHSLNDGIKNTKVKVRCPDGDTDYFDIVAAVLQGNTLDPNLFIICLDNVLWTSIDKMKDNGFKLTKERSRRYPEQTIADADYADDIALLENTSAQAETRLHSLERAAAGIGLHINADKTEYMWFNQRGNISTLNGSSLKLLDKFTYLESNV